MLVAKITQHFVGPDLVPNCLQMLSAIDTSRQRVKGFTFILKTLKEPINLRQQKIYVKPKDQRVLMAYKSVKFSWSTNPLKTKPS